MEKYITFSVPVKKKCDDGKTITRKLRFFDSFRFMSASLSDLAGNLSRMFISKICNKCMERKKINAECKFHGLEDDRLSYKCRECREKWHDSINGLINKFPSIYQICNGDLDKFILLLRKVVYPSEDRDSWEKFDETTIPPKEAFYSNLNEECMFCVIHCLQMCLKTLEISVLKYMNLISHMLCPHRD